MEMAKEVDDEITQKERKEEGKDCFFRGEAVSEGNDQCSQMDKLPFDLNARYHN